METITISAVLSLVAYFLGRRVGLTTGIAVGIIGFTRELKAGGMSEKALFELLQKAKAARAPKESRHD